MCVPILQGEELHQHFSVPPMTLWSCVLYTIANIIGMGLYLRHRHQRALEELHSRDPNANRRHRSAATPPFVLSSFNPFNLFRRQNLRTNSHCSLLSLLGLTYNGYSTFYAFEDRFSDFEEVAQACKKAGLETCGLIVGVDFSASNEWQGRKTFQGQNLHKVSVRKNSDSPHDKGKHKGLHSPPLKPRPREIVNPYEKVLNIMGRTIESIDEDSYIPAYGFGDNYTAGRSVFSFKEDHMGEEMPCQGFGDLLQQYQDIAAQIILGGPTNFAPIIYKAIDIVRELRRYHILILLADGQVTESSNQDTITAIVEASHYPLSIIVVGVGDGPWDKMEEFDNRLPDRSFDNFQFVNYHDIVRTAKKNADATFALHAMMEIPDQYKTIKALGYLDPNHDYSSTLEHNHREKTISFRTVLDYGNGRHLRLNQSSQDFPEIFAESLDSSIDFDPSEMPSSKKPPKKEKTKKRTLLIH